MTTKQATKPRITVRFDGADEWLRANGHYLTSDHVCAIRPLGDFKPGKAMRYEDREEGTTKTCSWADHVKALELLVDWIGRDHPDRDKGHGLYVGGIKHPGELLDAGNWDVEVVDAFWQLVYRQDVIYG